MSSEFHTVMADGSVIDTRTGDTITAAPGTEVEPVTPEIKSEPISNPFPADMPEQGNQLGVIPTKNQAEEYGVNPDDFRWDGRTYVHKSEYNEKIVPYVFNPKTNENFPQAELFSNLRGIVREGFNQIPEVPVPSSITTLLDQSGLTALNENFIKTSKTAVKLGVGTAVAITPEPIKKGVGGAFQKLEESTLGISQQLNVSPAITETLLGILEFGLTGGGKGIAKAGGEVLQETSEAIARQSPQLATVGNVSNIPFIPNSRTDNTFKHFFESRKIQGKNPGFPSSRISLKTQIVDPRKWAEVFTNVRGTGHKMRDAASVLFQTLEDGSAITLNYKKMGRYFASRVKDIKGSITNVHHVGFLEKLKHGLINHSSFELMEKAAKKGQIMASPIVQELDKIGIKLGNFDQNVVDLFSKLPDRFRTARVNDIYSKLGGAFTTDQIDALLGTTGKFWKELTEQQRKVLEGLRRTGDTEGIENIWKELNLPDINKTKIPGKGYKLPDGTTWHPKTYKEFKNRFKIFAEKAGIKVDIPDKFSELVGKVDSKLEFFGGDHDLVHEIFTKLEKDVNSRIYEIDRIIKSPNFRTMDPKKVAGLIKEQVHTMETIAANVMEFRIKELDKLYTKLVKEGKYKPAIKDSKFTDLGEKAMQRFIELFPNEAAVAGGLDLERHFSNINNALKKFDNPEMLKFMERAFGFKGQTFDFAGQTLKSK